MRPILTAFHHTRTQQTVPDHTRRHLPLVLPPRLAPTPILACHFDVATEAAVAAAVAATAVAAAAAVAAVAVVAASAVVAAAAVAAASVAAAAAVATAAAAAAGSKAAPMAASPVGPGRTRPIHTPVGASEVLSVGVAATTSLVTAFVVGLGATSLTAQLTFTQDSGASCCFFRDWTDLKPLHTPVPVTLADPSVGSVVVHSTTILPCPSAPSGFLTDYYIPLFSRNLCLWPLSTRNRALVCTHNTLGPTTGAEVLQVPSPPLQVT
ncbi:unnamed protein product [Closterium sp. NIES-53]